MNSIYNRPMFQNPQRRAGGGIMAGIAPINEGMGPMKLNDGGFMSSDLVQQANEVSKFFFDPTDPIDQMSMALIFFPPAAAAARLVSMGIKGAKLAKQVQKHKQARDAVEQQIGKEPFKDLTTQLSYGTSGLLQAKEEAKVLPQIGDSLVELKDALLAPAEGQVAQMNQGGIAMLANGGEAKPEVPDDIKGFLDFYEMDFETFMKLPEEKQQVYIENFQDRQDLIDITLDNPLASFIASGGDAINALLEAPGDIYDSIKYSGIAKMLGVTDPLAEPVDDPSFQEDREAAIEQQAPTRASFEEYEGALKQPTLPETPVSDETKEKLDIPVPKEKEPTTLLGRVIDGLDTITGGKIDDPMKRRALLAAVGGRELGESRGQAYVKALQEQELIDIRRKEQESAAQARIANQIPEIAKTIEYLKTQMPGTSVGEILTVFLNKGSDSQKQAAKIISDQATALREDPMSQGRFEKDNEVRSAQGLAPLNFDQWIIETATRIARAAFFESDLGSSSTEQMSLEEMQEILAKQKE